MSYPSRNYACSFYEVPIKTFVKEKGECSVETAQKNKFNLNFDGNEAKITYNEIISLQCQCQSNSSLKECNTKSNNYNSKLKPKKSNNLIVQNINKLFKAVELGDIEYVTKNFYSENVNISDQFGWTPLMSAAYSGHIEIIRYLLELGANIIVKDKSGFTAIDLALKRNYLDIVRLIKQNSHKIKKDSSKESNKESDIRRLSNNVSNEQESNKRGFYCDICKIFILESSRNKHETSTLHIFNRKPKIHNTFYGIPKQNKGYQMLLNNGWKEEGGLGPDGEGKKYPVKTVLKRDRKGFGQLEKNLARVTHFNPKDTNAVKFINKNKKKIFKKKDWETYYRRDAMKTKALRQALS